VLGSLGYHVILSCPVRVSTLDGEILFANDNFKGYLVNKIIEELREMEETELREVYSSILSRKVKVEK
jgi:hypothetical protein